MDVKNYNLDFGFSSDVNQPTKTSYDCMWNAFRFQFEDSNSDFYPDPYKISLAWLRLLQREICKIEGCILSDVAARKTQNP